MRQQLYTLFKRSDVFFLFSSFPLSTRLRILDITHRWTYGFKMEWGKMKKKKINLNNIIHRLGDIISHWSSDVYLLYYIIYECKRTRVLQVYYYCYLLCAPRWSGVSPVINSNNHVVISFVFNWLYRSRRGALCNSVWPIRYFFIIIHRRPSRLLVYIIYTRIYPNSCIN